MKKKIFFLLIGFILPLSGVYAQYAEDALRFSQTEQGATARIRALGNAQTALGGDLSSLSANPAGLGLFTRSDISLTPDFTNTNIDAGYFGENTSSQMDKLGLTHIGGVWHNSIKKPQGSNLNTGWLSFNFGVSYSKTNNLNSSLDYKGINSTSSFADYLADITTNQYLQYGDPEVNTDAIPAGILEDMAYSNYLIEYSPDGYFAATELNNSQRNSVYRTGSQSEVNFGFGANYSNRLFIGASIALTSLNYTADRQFTESGLTRDYTGQPADFAGGSYGLNYRSYQNTTGSGLNLKLGMIYRASDNVRLGFDFITPTWYSITDDYSEGLDTRYWRQDGTEVLPPYTNDDAEYYQNYNLRTPYRLNGGIAVTFANKGLITGDVEYVDYASMHFTAKNDRALEESNNRDIRNTYTSAVNFRLGAEYKLNNLLSLRGGYNTTGNPYKHLDYSTENISGGLGYRAGSFYMDLTYVNALVKYDSRPYLISETYPDYNVTGSGEPASIKNTRSSVFLTVGTRF